MKKIAILGSTGSIGQSTLDIVQSNPDKFCVSALVAGGNIKLLAKQIKKFNPQLVCVKNRKLAVELRNTFSAKIKIFYGQEGAQEAAASTDAQIVVSAISGAAGLMPTLAAVKAGKDIALANKETMVIAGGVVNRLAEEKNIKILPVDSEHSAIFQCLEGQASIPWRIILTASGGPFYKLSKKDLKTVKPAQALKHPNWKMGKKITVDSATMMNKGLEVIEAKWLFKVAFDRIEVVVHPQSIVHSMVEFIDGSILAQMGIPDMRTPIAYALNYPQRLPNKLPRLNLTRRKNLEFCKPDMSKFSCLKLAYEAGLAGGTNPAVLNAANEVAVAAFLDRKIAFTDIAKIIGKILSMHDAIADPSIEEILAADGWARERTQIIIERNKS